MFKHWSFSWSFIALQDEKYYKSKQFKNILVGISERWLLQDGGASLGFRSYLVTFLALGLVVADGLLSQ